MNEENWDLDYLAQTNRAIRRFGFDDGWTRGIMMIRLRHTFLLKFLRHPFDYLAVFSVNHSRKSVFTGSEHDVQQFSVTEFEGVVSHV